MRLHDRIARSQKSRVQSGSDASCGQVRGVERQLNGSGACGKRDLNGARGELMGDPTPAMHCQSRNSQIHGSRCLGWTRLRYTHDTIAARLDSAEQNVFREIEAAHIGCYRAITEAAVKAHIARHHVEAQQVHLDSGKIIGAEALQTSTTGPTFHRAALEHEERNWSGEPALTKDSLSASA